ncbi:hypothetical protein BuS5_01594 [Desulfosarcina sp. BuS5]|uniref:hypothetical protein n=1 Tax=Desulfosarcina sp. BuS5 TaxID=933262 RepID=UPI0012FC0D76|nr:hypothetical protein [Desulfosarcina sp. BuS5]WDN88626.1 hypothetical protein BuS5_01594 [Desulfosarcina sp. BuS5]
MNKKINMGFSQQTFAFEQSHEQNSTKEVLAFIDSTIADNGQVTFEQVASHFSMQSDRWTKPLIRNLINDLFNDDKIHFIIDGKKILSKKIKSLLSEHDQSKSKFMQTRETLSIVKIHLSEPAQWKCIEIIKPEVVEESVLLKAQYLGKKLFKDIGPASQNSMCRNLRRHLRIWRSDLEEFQKVAGTGGYPGTNEIRKGLDLLNKLLSVYDPYQFIETFLNNEDRFCDAYSHFVMLENFYENQIHIWDALIKAVDIFKLNRMLLEKDPYVKKALETLCKILKNPKPYSMIKKIRSLISIVKAANDLIVEEQIASAKALAVERIEKKIDKVVKVLDEKNANNDTRNKALFPLQTSKKKINMASNFQTITDYLEDAIDQFYNVMEMLN